MYVTSRVANLREEGYVMARVANLMENKYVITLAANITERAKLYVIRRSATHSTAVFSSTITAAEPVSNGNLTGTECCSYPGNPQQRSTRIMERAVQGSGNQDRAYKCTSTDVTAVCIQILAFCFRTDLHGYRVVS
jgi:peptide deformylase